MRLSRRVTFLHRLYRILKFNRRAARLVIIVFLFAAIGGFQWCSVVFFLQRSSPSASLFQHWQSRFLPLCDRSRLGLSTARLKVLDSAFQAEVDSGKIPGAV